MLVLVVEHLLTLILRFMQYDFIRSERKYNCINNNQVYVTHDQINTTTKIGENFKLGILKREEIRVDNL